MALANNSVDSSSSRDIVLHHREVLPLLSLLSISGRPSLLVPVSCILPNLCNKPLPTPIEKVGVQSHCLCGQTNHPIYKYGEKKYALFYRHFQMLLLLPILTNLIMTSDEQIVTIACWILFCLSDDAVEMVQAIVEAGFVPRLVTLLMYETLLSM